MQLPITLIQSDIAWEDPERNLEAIARLLDSAEVAPRPGGLIVLPEMYATGFTMNPVAVAQAESAAREGLSELAKRTESLVIGGVAAIDQAGYVAQSDLPTDPVVAAAAAALRGDEADASGPQAWGVNEALAFGADGAEQGRYRKIRTFSYTEERLHYHRGRTLCHLDWEGWRICPLICYDLRFPELFRAGLARGVELFVVVANWPVDRVEHWVTLLRARAIENQAWVVGVNRTGTDPRYEYPGRSIVVDPHEGIRHDAGSGEGAYGGLLDRTMLKAWRAEFPAWRDRIPPGELGD